MKKICGLDEAGRGPVLGDLFIGCVLCTQSQIDILKENYVDDSKKLSKEKREKLYPIIIKNCIGFKVGSIPVEVIDKNLTNYPKKSLNELEMELMRDLIISMEPDEIYIDAVGSNSQKFAKLMDEMLKEKIDFNSKIIARHKADSIFTVVGAASILAKVDRDRSIENYQKNYSEFGDIGSGYTSDKKTINFLRSYVKKNGKLPPIARKSWKTSDNILNDILRQKKITDFI